MTEQEVYVYFITAGRDTPLKIGIADDPERRLQQLQTAHYQTLKVVLWIKCRTREEACKLEEAFHSWYAAMYVRGEWYNVSPDRAVADARLLFQLAGLVDKMTILLSDDEIHGLNGISRLRTAKSRDNTLADALLQAEPETPPALQHPKLDFSKFPQRPVPFGKEAS